MLELLHNTIEVMKTVPSYMMEGLMELLIMTVGGIIVGYITSKYLYRINELNKVEGWLLEKRIPIYEELFRRTGQFAELCMVSPVEISVVRPMIERNGIQLDETAEQVSNLFLDPEKLTEAFLGFDAFAAQHKLMLDTNVAKEILVFSNYFALLRRMLVLFDEQMMDSGIDDNPQVKAVRKHLVVALGMCLSNEFLDYAQSLQNVIRVSITHLELSHREKPDYSYDFYQNESGYMMSRLKDTKALKYRDEIQAMITGFVAMGMLAGGIQCD